jgi:hypothetical protein
MAEFSRDAKDSNAQPFSPSDSRRTNWNNDRMGLLGIRAQPRSDICQITDKKQ